VLAYEPHAALFVPDNDPLLFYKKIATFAQTHLKPNGSICMEIHENFSEPVAELFKRSYPQVDIKQDGYGKNRMILVTT
jgi:release factor glutamine methyltransferase